MTFLLYCCCGGVKGLNAVGFGRLAHADKAILVSVDALGAGAALVFSVFAGLVRGNAFCLHQADQSCVGKDNSSKKM